MMEVETYADLAEALRQLKPEQLKQKVQVEQAGSDPLVLQPVIAIGTYSEFYSDGDAEKQDVVFLATDITGDEDDSERRKLRVLMKEMEKIANMRIVCPHDDIPRDIAVDALKKVAAIDEKKKEKKS